MTLPIVERLRDRLKVSQATEDEAADLIESRSARIAELEARQHGGEHGAAGDAIDFALGHLTDERDVVDFLDSWRDETVGIRFPEYTEWLAVQRAGAAEASLTKDSTSG